MALNFQMVRKSLTTAGTPVQVTSSLAACQRCDIFAPKTNTSEIYIGRSDLSATARRTIDPGTGYFMLNVDASRIYVDGVTNGDDIEFVFYF